MANRLPVLFPQYFDSTPVVRAGGVLRFYAAGTSTPLAVYSNKDLTISLGASVTLNALGQPETGIFLQNLAYKVSLEDSSGVVIWTEDNVFSADYSVTAKIHTTIGSPNGSVAGTAGSATVPADMVWDATNSILYVCTATGDAASAVWTAINAATAAAVVPQPQGYLTPTSGTPVIGDTDVVATTIYYTPYKGNTVPIYNGLTFVPTAFSELALALSASHALTTIYDVFATNDSGVVRLVTGPAWSNSGEGTGNRGSGAGTTQIVNINGIWVNAVQMTGRNGTNTYSVAANRGTYLGSIYIDATSAGQVTCCRQWGQSRKWGIWNAYNRNQICLRAGDSTASWSYVTNAWRASNADTRNCITTLCGLPEATVFVDFVQDVSLTASSGNNAIGLNSGLTPFGISGVAAGTIGANTISRGVLMPGIGINKFTAIEKTSSGASATYFGTESAMVLSATWVG